MSALTWGTEVGYAGGTEVGYAGAPAAQRPHLVLLPGGAEHDRPLGGLRVTRRGRVALVVLVFLAVVVGWTGLRGAGAAEAPQVVTVEPGQTLSEIAAAELPNHSISAGIVAIQLENRLSTAQVSAGQRLVIPRG